MKLINRWPSPEDLQLPLSIHQALIKKLTEPFEGCTQSAQDFWKNYGCFLIVPESRSQLERLFKTTTDATMTDAQSGTEYAVHRGLENPDLIEPLPEGYQLRLVITGDEGGGLYLLLPPDFDHQPQAQDKEPCHAKPAQ